ncbi:9598_t:CDS:2, partial [Diversispora eburnea]
SVENELEISPGLPINDEPKSNNEAPPTQISYPPRYQAREQREIRLRQKATDARMCGYAKEAEEDPSEYMDMTVRERLISEEIIHRSLEEDGIISSWLDTDEEWKKTINILQENGMLWQIARSVRSE